MSTKGSKAAPSSAVAKPYEPTSREQEAIEAHFARRRKRPPAPRMKVMVKGALGNRCRPSGTGSRASPPHGGDRNSGAGFPGWAPRATRQCRDKRPRRGRARAQLHARGGQRRGAEGSAGSHARGSDGGGPQRDHDLRRAVSITSRISLNKTARCAPSTSSPGPSPFKWKPSSDTGEQKVTVEHVTVNEGGQAIVGSVTHGGGARGELEGILMNREYCFQKAPRCSATSKRYQEALPGSRREGLDRLPVPWRSRRSTQGQDERSLSAWALHGGGHRRAPRTPQAPPGEPGASRNASMRERVMTPRPGPHERMAEKGSVHEAIKGANPPQRGLR